MPGVEHMRHTFLPDHKFIKGQPETGSELADDLDRSAIFDQVQMGVAVRMACLKSIVENKEKNGQ